MSCESYLELIDTPESLLTPQESQVLADHLTACTACAQLVAAVREEILSFQAAPSPEPSPDVWAQWVHTLEQLPHPVPAPVQTLEPSSPQTQPLPLASRKPSVVGVAGPSRASTSAWAGSQLRRPLQAFVGGFTVLGLVMLSLSVFQSSQQNESAGLDWSGLRTKGDPHQAPRLVDLQAVTEHIPGPHAQPILIATEHGAQLGPDDGLLFRFQVQGGSNLVLIERTPEHRLSVIYQHKNLDPSLAVLTTFEITKEGGQLLRFVPKGPAGEYTYIAVLSDEPLDPSPRLLDRVWTQLVEEGLSPLQTSQASSLTLDALRVEVTTDSASNPNLPGGNSGSDGPPNSNR